jgi:hypothetical protein
MDAVKQAQIEAAPIPDQKPPRFSHRIMEALRGRGWEEGEINWMDPQQAFREVMIWELGHVEWATGTLELIESLGGKVVWPQRRDATTLDEETLAIAAKAIAANLGYEPIEEWPQRPQRPGYWIIAFPQDNQPEIKPFGKPSEFMAGGKRVALSAEAKGDMVQFFWFCLSVDGGPWISFDARTVFIKQGDDRWAAGTMSGLVIANLLIQNPHLVDLILAAAS